MNLRVTDKKLSELTGYGLSRIKRLRLTGEWTKGVHYFQESSRIFTFDIEAIIIWQKGLCNGEYIKPKRCDMGELISGWAKDKEVHQVSRYQREQKAS